MSVPAVRGWNRKLEVIIIIMTTIWSFGFHPGLRLSNIAQEIIPPSKKKNKKPHKSPVDECNESRATDRVLVLFHRLNLLNTHRDTWLRVLSLT